MISWGQGKPWGEWRQFAQISVSYNLSNVANWANAVVTWDHEWVSQGPRTSWYFIKHSVFMCIFFWGRSHEFLDFNRGSQNIKNFIAKDNLKEYFWALITSVVMRVLLGAPGGLRPGAVGPRSQQLSHGTLTLVYPGLLISSAASCRLPTCWWQRNPKAQHERYMMQQGQSAVALYLNTAVSRGSHWHVQVGRVGMRRGTDVSDTPSPL